MHSSQNKITHEGVYDNFSLKKLKVFTKIFFSFIFGIYLKKKLWVKEKFLLYIYNVKPLLCLSTYIWSTNSDTNTVTWHNSDTLTDNVKNIEHWHRYIYNKIWFDLSIYY
jgi:hypothetical protein